MKREKYSVEEKKKIIIDYIKKNINATYKDILKETKLHPERVFKSLKYAFEGAGIKPPRTFERKNKEERRRIIVNYIKKHPKVGGQTILKETKINVSNAFSDIREAYNSANVDYPRKDYLKLKKRPREERKKEIIKLVKTNPLISISEIVTKTKTNPYRIFRNFNEIYRKSETNRINGHNKRLIKKKKEIIEFIKKNPLATQREINKRCKTHVQNTFNRGIFEAYERAGIKFPFERLKLYGVGVKEIRDRARDFEKDIAILLSGYGKVNRLVKMKRGFADIILERKGKKIIIEIKDYKNKEISISQIRQLNKYLEDSNSNLGFLICHKKPKKDRFLIDKNTIFILEKEELKKLPEIIDGSVV